MTRLHFLLLAIFLMLSACQGNANPTPQNDAKDEANHLNENESTDDEKNNVSDKEVVDQISLKNFFMNDGTIAEFKGEGNEFASYTAKTEWLNDRFVNVYEDNGGTVFLRTFRIDEDKIVVVREEGESYDPYMPSDEELEKLEPEYTYLQLPLRKGEKFADWTVIDDAALLDSPLESFKDVIVIEKQDEDSITRNYFVRGYGEIKREFTMKEDDNEFIVTSTIEKIIK